MPKQDVGNLVFELMDDLKSGWLAGYVLAVVFLVGWYLHARYQRRLITGEMRRIAKERDMLQAQSIGKDLKSSQGQMTIAMFTLLYLAVFHFIYEGILAPSFRLTLRFQLFGLRDDVRNLKIDCGNSLDDRHFDYLHDSINFLIAVLYRFDFASLSLAEQEAHRDPEFRKRAEERAKLLDDCNIPYAREIRKKSLRIAAKALAVNSGAWGIYVVPFALAFAGISEIKSRIRIFASLSRQDFKKVAPEDSLISSPS